ncbi:FAD-dependent thymidylate synthase [Melioribacter roseus P3M-2]|uniref:Flavin-dependent thymidylate synthase n=1 Tax=Melioribacter roseus (strain DSM 23840 / JCM 17771 / VKM B-2668 / P3M-2) TaxID=1191523 RepID=I7A7W6_MELRP|nr:FAD-dependent thymidylate synthase [Melioribacter roseus]AFN75956.1 FAD-dependent thymidylate synthase [Melioribacter roseus P3M-2]
MENKVEILERVSVKELDSILGKKFPVLDDGFIRVVDYMGSDESIVQAARVSYGKGTKKVSEDRGLIRYLLRNQHTTPFEMCEIKFHLRVPMDTWRQWIRHRTANVNEYSTRYSIAIDATQKTDPDKWRLQAKDNKQGSEGFLSAEVGKILSEKEIKFQNYAREIYKERIEAGVAREQARKDLPLSTYTEAYWKIDLHNLLRFISLRMDSHAQYEIRQYAEVIGKEIVARWCPITWEAFMDYIYNGVKFSALELNVLKAINSGDKEEVLRLADEYGWLRKIDDRLAKNRERIEFEEKLNLLGIQIPWA